MLGVEQNRLPEGLVVDAAEMDDVPADEPDGQRDEGAGDEREGTAAAPGDRRRASPE